MTQEEKAKCYDDAIKKAESLYKAAEPMSACNVIIETLFPELAKSEDERIRKSLIDMLKNDEKHYLKEIAWLEKQCEHANFRNKIQIGDKVTRNEDGVLVNLSQLNRVAKKDEKQGEQKSASMSLDEAIKHCEEKSCGNNACALEHKQLKEWLTELKELKEQRSAWSEEDDNCLSTIIAEFSKCAGKSVSKDEWMRCNDFLNSLKDRVQPQPKQEWSEEGEVKINRIVTCLENLNVADNDILLKDVDWLKSLRHRSQWKPSEEQMLAINTAINVVGKGTISG